MPAIVRLWPSNDDDNEEEENGDDDGDGAIVLRKRRLLECTEVQTCSLETAWWALRLPPLVMGPTCTSQIPPRSIQRGINRRCNYYYLGTAAAAIEFFFTKKQEYFFYPKTLFKPSLVYFYNGNGNQVPLKGEHLG